MRETPCEERSERMDGEVRLLDCWVRGVRRAAYSPPLPSGATATFPGDSSRIFPSMVRHGRTPISM